MGLSDNAFIGLPLADIQELRALYVQVLKDIATAGQSYSFPGRSFTRANLAEIKATLAEVNVALKVTTGTGGKQIAQAVIDTQSKFHE